MAGFGVHLGNSSICLAQSKDGKTDVVANHLGDRVTPAIISHNGQEYEMCGAAKTGFKSKAFISCNKSQYNADVSDEQMESLNSKSDWKLIREDDSLVYQMKVNDKTISITPEQIASKYYKEMCNIATHAISNDDIQAVLAVPYDWSDESRDSLRTAAEDAGLTVLQLINEPAAAVFAYDTWNYTEEHNILVYRLGGVSCDVSIVNITGGLYTIEKYEHVTGIGGQNITEQLADFIAKEFHQKWKLDPNENKRAKDKLIQHANVCKHVLSSLTTSHIFIESLYEGVDWSQNVSRARFENLLTPNIDSYLAPVHKILSDTDYKEKIDTVIFCGGTMKIPKIRSAVSSLFPNAQVLNGHSPDEVIAQGCAKQAALIIENSDFEAKESTEEFDCISKGIYAKYLDTKISLFGRGSPNNAEVSVPFKRADDSTKIYLELFEENEDKPIADYTFTSKSASLTLHAMLRESKLTVDVV